MGFTIKGNPTKRAPDPRDSARFTGFFHTSAESTSQTLSTPARRSGNANRWGAEPKPNTKPSLIRKFRFIVEIKNQIQFLAVVFFK
jgi:hypothetical protein